MLFIRTFVLTSESFCLLTQTLSAIAANIVLLQRTFSAIAQSLMWSMFPFLS
ncbi:hypothetical protein H6G00_22050 [Leptolyngbya sp. FACHB-541]|nr:hypothetical protein [Leptolyngbya sp. FACHB-541]